MQHIIAKIQQDGVVWLQDIVLSTYRPAPTDYVHALHKVYILFSIYKIFLLTLFMYTA